MLVAHSQSSKTCPRNTNNDLSKIRQEISIMLKMKKY